ncbi:golgin subfamily A member 5-like isoform X4 [Ruditapes philippinarum]|uniref:golgin subfamily A member 5-like isoform X4 n=1 Tax=Ruditapes philippinarum TaxID=129788 RepID=UPI00295B3525|nr:golgin subfamily A member 5-like isoform X4 [Ruditapes philippinarum]
MAWLSGLTGKAENFLNSLDQTAAKVLHENEEEGHSPNLSRKSVKTEQAVPQSSGWAPFISPEKSLPSQSATKSFDNKLRELPQDASLSTKPKSESVTTKKKTDKDEALFEFLNSPEPTERRKITPANSTRHSRQSSASSVISNKGGKNDTPGSSSGSGSSMVHVEMPDIEDKLEEQTTNMQTVCSTGNDSRGSPTDMDMAALEDAMQDQSPSNSVHSNQDIESRDNPMTSSSLDLENRLLKNEISSLNQEMTSLVQRAKDSESDLAKLREKLKDQSRNVSKSDQSVRELQNREQDLLEAIGAKDSQLGVLRIRLEEADRELQNRQKHLESLKSDKERILRDHTDSSGIHGQALDSLRQKLSEVEATLEREQEANKISRQEAADRQTRMEEEQRSFTEALASAEKKYSDEKGWVTELNNQLKSMRNSLESAKQELSEYKEKATRILQSKERLIASLREGSGASGEAAGVSSLEYDTVKQERDMFKEEIQQARMTVENLKVELADVESQMQQENDTAQDTIRSLEDNIGEEKQRREDSEQELLKQKRELQYAIEELHKQKTSFQSRMKDRESEIERLRNQLATKSMSSTSESELESRVRELTESLIQKQTMVEALSTEKNSLGLQLERLGQQYKDIQASAVRTNTTVIPVHDDDEVRQRLPQFMREVPTDTEVTRKMKRAVNSIDKFSIRLGVFFRRYPIARVFVIVYMALLHLWVMIVLLTYQPEIHGAGADAIKLPEAPDK